MFPLSVDKIVSLVEQQGYAVIYEPLLVYDKEEQHVRLSSGPKSLEQIIKKLNFCPISYQELLNKCNQAGITCSGGVQFCKDYESYLRFNIACPFNQLKEGLYRLVQAFKQN